MSLQIRCLLSVSLAGGGITGLVPWTMRFCWFPFQISWYSLSNFLIRFASWIRIYFYFYWLTSKPSDFPDYRDFQQIFRIFFFTFKPFDFLDFRNFQRIFIGLKTFLESVSTSRSLWRSADFLRKYSKEFVFTGLSQSSWFKKKEVQ